MRALGRVTSPAGDPVELDLGEDLRGGLELVRKDGDRQCAQPTGLRTSHRGWLAAADRGRESRPTRLRGHGGRMTAQWRSCLGRYF